MNSNICTKQQNRKNLQTSKQQRILKIAKARKKQLKNHGTCVNIFLKTRNKRNYPCLCGCNHKTKELANL
jgi:hypothetical protein